MKSIILKFGGWRFIFLVAIVTFIQFDLLGIVLQNGYTAEDWWILFNYKAYNFPDFFSRYIATFRMNGLHHTYQVMYIGILEGFFKGNYQAYQLTSIIIKILATISLYPLILRIFKNRLLAFLTTLFYGISFSSSGALYFVCTGGEYLAILFMNMFLLTYYYYFVKRRNYLLFVSTTLLFISFILAPIRIYPLFAFIFFIEIFILIKKNPFRFTRMIFRLVLLYFPYLLILIFVPGSTSGQLNGPGTVLHFILYGNYQLAIIPFAGLGYTFLTNDVWPLFGSVSFTSFKDYLAFLLHGPFIIYPVLTVLLSFLIAKRSLTFIFGIISANAAFEIISYLLITHLKGASGPDVKSYQAISTNATFFGFFVISIALASLIAWLRRSKPNILLLSLFIGPLFSSIFLWGIWLIKGDVLNFKEGIHWYLVLAPIGSSLFLSGLLVLLIDKIKKVKKRNIRYVLTVLVILVIAPIYFISSKEINSTFTELIRTGYRASDQEEMKHRILSFIKYPLENNSTLFYFEAANQKYFPISLLYGFNERMLLNNWEIINGCVGMVSDKNILQKSIVEKDGIKGFNVTSVCVNKIYGVSRPEVFYKPVNFYAFKLKNRDVMDIKETALLELGFK